MNLLLYRGAERSADGRLELPAGDRRLRHILEILKARAGDRLRVGRLNGPRGWAVLEEEPELEQPCHLRLTEEEPDPPSRAPGRVLLLALPRPPALRRILQLAPQLGLERVILTGSARVEKSYFHSPLLSAGEWREQLILGLEQAQVTRLPDVRVAPRLHELLQGELESLLPVGGRRLLPHPGPWPGVAGLSPTPADWCLAVGPEGGWVEAEVAALVRHGFEPLSLGPRILKVETALQRLVAQLDLLQDLQPGDRA
ncbi:MAG: RsmE family RNA methyltransferase [Candidatus Delongbacteria bacterium]